MNEIRRAILNETLGQINTAAKRIEELQAKEFRDMAAIPDQIENSAFGKAQKEPLDHLTRAVLKLEEAAAHIAAAVIAGKKTEGMACSG